MRPVCSWVEVGAIALVAAGGGVGLGASYSHLVFGAPLPWIAAHHAIAIDANTIATTFYLHVDGISVPSLDRNICPEEAEMAKRARDRVQALLGEGSVRVKITHENEYGQIDALFVGADRPIREILLREGLARKSDPRRPAVWCPNERLPPGAENPKPTLNRFLTWSERTGHIGWNDSGGGWSRR